MKIPGHDLGTAHELAAEVRLRKLVWLGSPAAMLPVNCCETPQAVGVAVGVRVGDGVRVAVGTVPVAVGVGVPAPQPGNLKLPMRVRQLNWLVVA